MERPRRYVPGGRSQELCGVEQLCATLDAILRNRGDCRVTPVVASKLPRMANAEKGV